MKAGSMERGYYSRQSALGLLPDEDDCQEAIEGCLDICEAYEPPSGSDVFGQHGGSHFYDDI